MHSLRLRYCSRNATNRKAGHTPVYFRLPLFHAPWRRTIQGIAALFLMTIAIDGLYQTVSLIRERSAFPMPGRLVGVGGYKMHIYCNGQGSPAVILDSGLGDSFISWQNVQPQIAGFVRVCSYDRAGMGYSEASPRPRTSIVFAEEQRSCRIGGASDVLISGMTAQGQSCPQPVPAGWWLPCPTTAGATGCGLQALLP